MTPAKPARPQAGNNTPFGSKIIQITIGKERAIFNIHAEKLRKTSFFLVHGRPSNTKEHFDRVDQQLTATDLKGDDPLMVKNEEGEFGDIEMEHGTQSAEKNPEGSASPKAATVPDYHIEDKFHIPSSFKIYAQWLYNENPTLPTNRTMCKELLQAYVLALIYKAYPLQNVILDRFRAYHINTYVNFDDYVWMAGRVGEDIQNCALTKYLLEQVAFDIGDRGYGDFAKSNGYLEPFLKESPLHEARYQLFITIAKYSHASNKPVDPASGKNLWLVYEQGPHAGMLRADDPLY